MKRLVGARVKKQQSQMNGSMTRQCYYTTLELIMQLTPLWDYFINNPMGNILLKT